MADKNYLQETIRDYVEDLAAKLPAPGGGSASACSGALGIALLCMVCNFTIGKEMYREVENEVRQILNSLDSLREQIVELIQKDVEVYKIVSSAYKMPRTTEEEKQKKSAAIQEACKKAMEVPVKIAKKCRAAMDISRRLVDIGSTNLISDVGVGVLLLESAVYGAALNVEINLAYINDCMFVDKNSEILKNILKGVDEVRDEVYDKTLKKIKK